MRTQPGDFSHIIYFAQNNKGQFRETLGNHGGAGCLRALHFTLAFVIDLPRSNDFVEDSSERLVLSYDSRRDEWRHDELPLTDVRFHGYPGRETSGREEDNISRWPLTGDRQMDRRAAKAT